MRIFMLIIVGGLLNGCAGAADIKPGQVRGLERNGYVKTTEGLALAVRGCSDTEVWQGALAAVTTLRSSSWQTGKQLAILRADQAAGRIEAIDERTIVGTTSYVGVFLHPPVGDLRLVEVSAFWKNRMAATENPWELAVLQSIEARLGPCVAQVEPLPAVRVKP